MKTLSIPVADRPNTFRRVLESIRAAEGWKDWVLVVSMEPGQACLKVLNEFRWDDISLSVNQTRMGCRINTFNAVAFANALGSDFNVYLEDDVILSRDALLLADAFRESGNDGILCFRRWHERQSPQHDIIRPARHGLLGDGFAYHRSMFEKLARYWFYDQPGQFGQMWDCSVDLGLNQEMVLQWRPMVNRSKNIGTQGTHTQGGGDLNHFGPCYDGDPITEFKFIL